MRIERIEERYFIKREGLYIFQNLCLKYCSEIKGKEKDLKKYNGNYFQYYSELVSLINFFIEN